MVGRKKVLETLMVCVLFMLVTSEQKCDKSKIVEGYADDIDNTDIVVCCEYTQIVCGKDYAPPLLEKRPTLFLKDVPNKDSKYVTIVFFGKYDDGNATALLWLAYNIEPQNLKEEGYTGQSGNEMVIYNKPRISNGPAIHVFLAYCQKMKFTYTDVVFTMEERENLDMRTVAKKKGWNNPVNGLYFNVTAQGQIMDAPSTSYRAAQTEGKCSRV